MAKGIFDGPHFIILTRQGDGPWQAENKTYKTWATATRHKYLLHGNVVQVVVDEPEKLKLVKLSWGTVAVVAMDFEKGMPAEMKNLLIVEEVQTA